MCTLMPRSARATVAHRDARRDSFGPAVSSIRWDRSVRHQVGPDRRPRRHYCRISLFMNQGAADAAHRARSRCGLLATSGRHRPRAAARTTMAKIKNMPPAGASGSGMAGGLHGRAGSWWLLSHPDSTIAQSASLSACSTRSRGGPHACAPYRLPMWGEPNRAGESEDPPGRFTRLAESRDYHC
jgi:hypothetical protein